MRELRILVAIVSEAVGTPSARNTCRKFALGCRYACKAIGNELILVFMSKK